MTKPVALDPAKASTPLHDGFGADPAFDLPLQSTEVASFAMSASAAHDATEAAAFLQAGGRIAVLVGQTAADRAALLDGVLERMHGPVVQVGNKLNSPLTLHRILFQAGAVGTEEDKGAALTRSLARQAAQGRIVLAVTDAQTLTPDGLTVLIRCTVAARFDLRLLLIGQPSLLHAVDAPGFETLRDPAITRIGTDAALAAAETTAARTHLPVPVRARPRALAIAAGLAAALALVVAIALAWRGQPSLPADPLREPTTPPGPEETSRERAEDPPVDLSTVAPSEGVEPAPPSPVARPALPPVAPSVTPPAAPPGPSASPTEAATTPPAKPADPDPLPATAPAPAPSVPPQPEQALPAPAPQALDEGQLRREFNAFLDRSGRDTATLSPGARATLFQEYLLWRSRHSGQN